jgi:hypothetical protein
LHRSGHARSGVGAARRYAEVSGPYSRVAPPHGADNLADLRRHRLRKTSTSTQKRNAMRIRSSLAPRFAVLACLGLPLLAHADDATHVGVALTAGLSGLGLDVGVNLNSFLGVRATVADYSINHNGNYGTSVDWDAKLKLFQAGLLLDGYPFAGGFHLTAGLVKDGNQVSLNTQPSTGGTYTFNGVSYPASQIGSASANVDWGKVVPYLGIGWGNLAGSAGLHFTSDVGVLITGSPSATISVACAANQVCAQLGSNVAAEQTKLQNDVNRFNVWPVLRFGVGYAF